MKNLFRKLHVHGHCFWRWVSKNRNFVSRTWLSTSPKDTHSDSLDVTRPTSHVHDARKRFLFSIVKHKKKASFTPEERGISQFPHVILVLSGKGGVGKSTVAAQIALGLTHIGKKVGLLDLDLCGPSIPRMFNLHGRDIHQCPEGWLPVFVDQKQHLAVMSIAFLLDNPDEAIVWRGPKKTAMIKQFLSDVVWRDLDYLVIDTPPGTSDEHISVVESLKSYNPDGAVLVTTPQAVAVGDVRRELTFCKKTRIPVLGIVENMSGFVCPHCTECTNIFSKGGGEALAKQFHVPFLGCIPLDPKLTQCLEEGKNFLEAYNATPTNSALDALLQRLIQVDKDF